MTHGGGKTALFLGGGAPNFTLMSGALRALHEKGIKFDIVSMAGAGAVVGLMYLSPKSLTPEQALENTVNFGISDEIYGMFPVNYKAFSKWGPSADAFNQYWFSLPQVQAAAHQYGKGRAEKLRDDWLLFMGAMLCPTDLNFRSTGLSEHPHFIDNLIDFERLRTLEQDIELNAFRLRDRTVVDFTKTEITADHLRAALSFPFIYPPYKIGNDYYYEGAAFQCINPSRIPPEQIDYFVVLQPMAQQQIRPPRDLWDAYSQSVMMPVAALAKYGSDAVEDLATLEFDDKAIEAALNRLPPGGLQDFIRSNEDERQKRDKGLATAEPKEPGREHYGEVRKLVEYAIDSARAIKAASVQGATSSIPLSALRPKHKNRWYEAKFEIAEDHLPYVFDWSRSNLEYLFDVGYVTGEDLADTLIANGCPCVHKS